MRALHALILSLCIASSCGCATKPDPSIALSDGAVIVRGLDAAALESQRVVEVRVADAPADAPPLLGRTSRRDDALVFTPRFPFEPGLRYRARFDSVSTTFAITSRRC